MIDRYNNNLDGQLTRTPGASRVTDTMEAEGAEGIKEVEGFEGAIGADLAIGAEEDEEAAIHISLVGYDTMGLG